MDAKRIARAGLMVALLDVYKRQQVDGLGVDEVVFAAQGAPLGEAERGELVGRGRMRDSLRGIHPLIEFALKLGEAHAAHAADRAREAAVDELRCEACLLYTSHRPAACPAERVGSR